MTLFSHLRPASALILLLLLGSLLPGVARAQSAPAANSAPEVTLDEKERRRQAARAAAPKSSNSGQRDPSRNVSYPSNL